MENDYTFNDSENRPPFIEPCDTIYEVIEVDCGVSAGKKTGGSRKVGLTLRFDPSGAICYDTLIFHPSMGWKNDTFVKSAGIVAQKGGCPVELAPGNEYMLVGLRGWCTVDVDSYVPPSAPPGAKPKLKNKIAVWLTNKPKLPRKPVVQPDPDEAMPF